MQVPRLHLVTDFQVCPFDRFLALLPDLLAAGVEAVQVRARELPSGQLLAVVRALRRVITPPAVLIVNDRLDVALLCEADGVQLPEEGLPVEEARRFLGGGRLLGRSVHSVAAARQAAAAGTDYLVFGHVFETASKPGLQSRGVATLQAVARAVSRPVIAIGGVTPERVPAVRAAGAYGVAVIRGILGASDPAATARAYRQALEGTGGV